MHHEEPPDIAFYYPGHLWVDTEWMKTLLLFFDGIGPLVPEYKQGDTDIRLFEVLRASSPTVPS